MKFNRMNRKFCPMPSITLTDTGTIDLEIDEQITVRTKSGRTNDIVRKSWGFYLSNSINHNLAKQGFKTALVVSKAGGQDRLYINLVERNHLADFMAYLKRYNAKVKRWMA